MRHVNEDRRAPTTVAAWALLLGLAGWVATWVLVRRIAGRGQTDDGEIAAEDARNAAGMSLAF